MCALGVLSNGDRSASLPVKHAEEHRPKPLWKVVAASLTPPLKCADYAFIFRTCLIVALPDGVRLSAVHLQDYIGQDEALSAAASARSFP